MATRLTIIRYIVIWCAGRSAVSGDAMCLHPTEWIGIAREQREIVKFFRLSKRLRLSQLRAGDIWVRGSRQYPGFETNLIPTATFEVMQKEPLPLEVETPFAVIPGRVTAKPRGQLDYGRAQGTGENIARCYARRRGSAHRPVSQEHPGRYHQSRSLPWKSLGSTQNFVHVLRASRSPGALLLGFGDHYRWGFHLNRRIHAEEFGFAIKELH